MMARGWLYTLLIAGNLAGSQDAVVRPGPLAQLRLPDLDGKLQDLFPSPARKQVVLFWQPDHTRALSALCDVARLLAATPAALLSTVVPGSYGRAEIEQAVRTCSVQPLQILADPDRRAFAAFGVVALPTAILVDSDHQPALRLAGFGSEALSQLQAALGGGRENQDLPSPAPASISPRTAGRFEMARRLLRAGMARQAEEQLAALTRDHPDYRPPWVALGYQRMAQEDVDAAFDCFEHARRLDPSQQDVAAGFAWVWLIRGNVEQADPWLRLADRKDERYPVIEQLRARRAGKGAK